MPNLTLYYVLIAFFISHLCSSVVFGFFAVQKEVILALPKLIKLNPIVVKEVFNRLLGTQHSKITY